MRRTRVSEAWLKEGAERRGGPHKRAAVVSAVEHQSWAGSAAASDFGFNQRVILLKA